MLDSPFRQPHQRQDTLKRLLASCRDRGDHRAAALLELQWVHRYGVDSLPDGSIDQPEDRVPAVTEAEEAEIPTLDWRSQDQDSELPPPPAPRLHRLRRWLPADTVAFPQAS